MWAEASIRYFSLSGVYDCQKGFHGAVVELIYSLKSSVVVVFFLHCFICDLH